MAANETSPDDHPPKPAMAFRVAVAGHRPDRLPDADAVREALAFVLGAVSRAASDAHSSAHLAYDATPPALRLITALAEGTDRIAADIAFTLGYELQAVLPFDRDTYALDFAQPVGDADAQESVAELRRFLANPATTAMLELDGVLHLSHAATLGTADLARGEAELHAAHLRAQDAVPPYESLAETLVRECDLLVAVWDGERARGPGGTANVIREAHARGVHAVIIDANVPGRLTFVVDGVERAFDETSLRAAMFAMLEPPHTSAADPLGTYLAERAPGWRMGRTRLPLLGQRSLLNWIWPSFRAIVSRSWRAHPSLSVALPPYRDPSPDETFGPAIDQQVNRVLHPHYAWADMLATYYGNRYRSAFVIIYILGVATVGLAVLGLADRNLGHAGRFDVRLWLTLGLLSVIVGIWCVGSFLKRWHRRWLDYRILAEYLRQMAYLAPLATSSPRVRTPPHRSRLDPGNSWMAWQARAVTRQLGVTTARFDGPFLEAARRTIRDAWLVDQAAYHGATAKRSQRAEQTLHWTSLSLFGLAFLSVAGAIYEERQILTALEAVFPALGSALAGIRGQAELERLARRSEGLEEWLDEIKSKLDLISTHPGTSASRSLRQIAELAAAGMLDEVLDWRVVLEVRPLELPV